MTTDPTPTLIDLVRELRGAVGLFDGAMPITPKAAWEEAIEKVKALAQDDDKADPRFNCAEGRHRSGT